MVSSRRLALVFFVALLVVVAAIIPTIIQYLALGQPETTFSTTILSPYPTCPISPNAFPCNVGNITVTVAMITTNPAGLSAGAPFTATVSVRFTNNFSAIPQNPIALSELHRRERCSLWFVSDFKADASGQHVHTRRLHKERRGRLRIPMDWDRDRRIRVVRRTRTPPSL